MAKTHPRHANFQSRCFRCERHSSDSNIGSKFCLYKWHYSPSTVFSLIIFSILGTHPITMQFTTLVLWRFISVLVLLVPLTRCAPPRPICHYHTALGVNLNDIHCHLAIQNFKNYRDTFLGISNSTHLSVIQKSRIRGRIYYFSNDPDPTTTFRMSQKLAHLPLRFSHQDCEIIIDMPATVTKRPVASSWARVNNAISSVFGQCVSRPSPIGGTVVYRGIKTSIAHAA
jgi:hypothetical protein